MLYIANPSRADYFNKIEEKKYTEPASQEGLNYREAVSMVILTRWSWEPVAM